MSFDPKSKKIPSGNLALEIQRVTRPTQRGRNHVWNYVTINNTDAEGEKLDISTTPADLSTKNIFLGVNLEEDDDYYLIDDGRYQFRLRNYRGKLSKTISLNDLLN
ncbi:MAG: hypothetical protein ABF379_03230 [Akkermansiaceae bacterium]